MGFFVSEMMGRFMSIQYYRMAISKRIIMICMMCYSSLYTESMNAKLREFYQISGDSLAILKAPEEKKIIDLPNNLEGQKDIGAESYTYIDGQISIIFGGVGFGKMTNSNGSYSKFKLWAGALGLISYDYVDFEHRPQNHLGAFGVLPMPLQAFDSDIPIYFSPGIQLGWNIGGSTFFAYQLTVGLLGEYIVIPGITFGKRQYFKKKGGGRKNYYKPPTAKVEPTQKKKPKPSLVDNTFSVHSGLGSARGIGLFGFSKDLLFTDNIGVYFSVGIGTPVSLTHMTYGVGTFFQSHYNDNGWNIAAIFGMAEIGGQNLTGLIYYQYRIGKRGLVSIGLLQGAFLRSRPASYWGKYIKDPHGPPSGRYKYTFPIISYDFLFL